MRKRTSEPERRSVGGDDQEGLRRVENMNTDLIPLGDVLDFFNGKAPTTADDDEYIVFGSNGPIGRSNSFNHEISIILGRVGAYCGSVEICSTKFWASDNTIVVKATNGNDLRYLYYRLLLLAPKEDIAKLFDDFVSHNFRQIGGLHRQNKQLRRARDLLLPRLMSGEVAV